MTSTIPAVLDALVTLGTLALPGVQVVDGQPVASTTELLCIGYTGTPGETTVEATDDVAQMTATPGRERYDITCLAGVLRGATDAKAARDRAFELVQALRSELIRDQTLGGLVMSARLAVLDLTPQQTPKGAQAEVRFVVRIDAFAR